MLDFDKRREISGHVIKHIDNSLPSLASAILNGYSIALEGWRRGLHLAMKLSYEREEDSRIFWFTLSDEEGTSFDFNSAAPSIMTDEARTNCKNKELTKKPLKEKGVPHAEGSFFQSDSSNEAMIKYANQLGYPVVVKPNDGYGGKGITTDIQNDQQLIKALDEIKEIAANSKIIIEKCFTGYDYRVYVIEDEVIASVQRVPANVTGDGESTLKELIDAKNKIRIKNNGPSNKKKIGIDEELKNTLEEKQLRLDTILPKGELVFLKKKANVSSGGESIDVTDELSVEYKQIAINAVKAIEGLHLGAVDLLIDEDKGTAIVLEINTKPGLDIQMYPTFGQARDIPAKIIDYLFPDTINYDRKSSRRMYFDFNSVYSMCYKRTIFEKVEVPDIPHNIILKRYFITVPKKFQKKFPRAVQRIAHRYRISGSLKRQPDKMTLIMAGSSDNVQTMIDLVKDILDGYNEPHTISEQSRTRPVRQGFDII